MIKSLKKESVWDLYYYINGKKVLGKNKLMHGNCADLWGNLDLWGNCTEFSRRMHRDVGANVQGLSGNLDLCKIRDLDRQSKINLDDLIQ